MRDSVRIKISKAKGHIQYKQISYKSFGTSSPKVLYIDSPWSERSLFLTYEGGLPVVQGHCLEKHDGCRKKVEADKKPMVSLFGILERRYQFTTPF